MTYLELRKETEDLDIVVNEDAQILTIMTTDHKYGFTFKLAGLTPEERGKVRWLASGMIRKLFTYEQEVSNEQN